MTKRFEAYIPFLWTWEGTTFEDDPDDRGGATKYGIDQRSHPNVNIRTLTESQARRIYWDEYWTAVRADDLAQGVGEVVMDIAVNNGKSRAAKWLQESVGAKVDGQIGPKTIEAASHFSWGKLADTLLARREAFYRSIAKGSQAKFLKGWLNRNRALAKFIGR